MLITTSRHDPQARPFRVEKLTLEKIHLFDPSSGRNLTLHEGRAAGALAD